MQTGSFVANVSSEVMAGFQPLAHADAVFINVGATFSLLWCGKTMAWLGIRLVVRVKYLRFKGFVRVCGLLKCFFSQNEVHHNDRPCKLESLGF